MKLECGKDQLGNIVIRRALAFTAAERYLGLLVKFLMLAAVSRLLTPEEIGVYVIGSGIATIALSLREFATAEYLIQRTTIARDDVRTSFTVLLGMTALISVFLLAIAPLFAAFYKEGQLVRYLQVIIAAGIIEVFSMPIVALLRRDMAFGALAVINTSTTMITSLATLLLAILGFSYMSFAWAWLAGAVSTVVLAVYFRPDPRIFLPSLKGWRNALVFGSYNGATVVVNRAYEALPQLVLGRVLPLSQVGLYNRASTVCGIPDMFIVSTIVSVAFPALSAEVRAGRDLKHSYLRAISYITVLYWPAQVLLALLAHPVVSIVLGDQWLGIVPLVQIISIAALCWFPFILAPPLLQSLGALRDNLVLNFAARSVSALVLCSASFFGIMAVALSHFVVQPYQMVLALRAARRHIPFPWRDLLAAIASSATVTACSAAGPVAVIAWAGFNLELTISQAGAATLLAALGWLIGLYVTQHPFLSEVERIAEAVRDSAVCRRLVGYRRFFSPRAR